MSHKWLIFQGNVLAGDAIVPYLCIQRCSEVFMRITPIQSRYNDDEVDAIDRYRREKRNPPTRSAAIKEIVRERLGLRQSEIKPP